MLYDVALHDVIGGHQEYMAHRILHPAKTTGGSRDARTLREDNVKKLRLIIVYLKPCG